MADRSEIAAGYVLHAYCGICYRCGRNNTNAQSMKGAMSDLRSQGWTIYYRLGEPFVRCPEHKGAKAKT
jgi:hypothetical protein